MRITEGVYGVSPMRFPAALRIGDEVIYHGRVLVLRGLEPMSVPTRRAEVEDPFTGERLVVPLDELEPAPPGFDPAA